MNNRRRTRGASNTAFTVATSVVAVMLAVIFFMALGHVADTPSNDMPVSGAESVISDRENSEPAPPSAPSEPESGDESGDESSEAQAKPALSISSDILNSNYACLFDRETGTVIAVKNAYTRVSPASLTKMATTITVIETCDDLYEMITVDKKTVDDMYFEGASVVGFKAGEQATVLDMLYGVMLPSGADAALSLAYRFGGTEAGFAELMNRKMAEIGLTDTHFVNVTGLDADNHYSTAADMAKLLDHCLKNELFRKICTTSAYKVTSGTKHADGIDIYHTAFRQFTVARVPNKYCLGGKTGTTTNAGRCLAALCEVDGKEYITVTIGADGGMTDGLVPKDLNTLIETVLPECKQA